MGVNVISAQIQNQIRRELYAQIAFQLDQIREQLVGHPNGLRA
ncbi:MAG: hypothetical protein NZ899_04890 [Thermoguttaceae bacterium]|nr:hypothetical protein [Thermoguttaceae bacterium]MDW8077923.1 hypothetical protein [Thermoguttaceae bacterium]